MKSVSCWHLLDLLVVKGYRGSATTVFNKALIENGEMIESPFCPTNFHHQSKEGVHLIESPQGVSRRRKPVAKTTWVVGLYLRGQTFQLHAILHFSIQPELRSAFTFNVWPLPLRHLHDRGLLYSFSVPFNVRQQQDTLLPVSQHADVAASEEDLDCNGALLKEI